MLQRQLSRVGIKTLELVPTADQFAQLLSRVSEQYAHARDDRDLLNRSLELSTQEMAALHARLTEDKERMLHVVHAVGGALTVLGDIPTSNIGARVGEVTGVLERAKTAFVHQLEGALGGAPADEERTTMVTGIRNSFLSLANQMTALIRDTASKAELEKELEVARTVQQLLLPPEAAFQTKRLQLAATFEPASHCGGDWYTVHELPDARVLVVVGDVTGHGIASAIVTGVAKAACDLARHMGREALTPTAALQTMNYAIWEAAKGERLMTATAAIFDPSTGQLQIASAGHPFPLLTRGGSIAPLSVPSGAPLGSSATATIGNRDVSLQRGDAVLWYTDGVTEIESPHGEQFGEKRLRTACIGASSLGAEGFRDALAARLTQFAEGRPSGDDITFVTAVVRADA